MSVSGTVVKRPWIVVSRTESSAFTALFHGATAPIRPGARRYAGFTMILRHTTLFLIHIISFFYYLRQLVGLLWMRSLPLPLNSS